MPRSVSRSSYDADSPRAERFCLEYLKDCNAAHAAERAGYSTRRAKQVGYELLQLPAIQARIVALQAERAEVTKTDADYVARNAREIVERCLQRAPVLVRRGTAPVQATDEEGRAVWQFDARGAVQALTLLARLNGLLVDKVEHSGAIALEQILARSYAVTAVPTAPLVS